MTKRNHLALAAFVVAVASPLWCYSQATDKPYFQQEVNYRIAVALDDSAHTLTGNIEIEYVNNAPEALTEIWMHLWGNAYKNRQTAFCRQKLRDGSTGFYFTDEKNLGYYKNLDFSVDGQKVAWKYDRNNPDIAVLQLAQPLPPGGRILIATPFLLKIPASFSRLGHVGTSYQMSQWYPKPAVYDRKGWHAMPYLDMGEFYSEFGSFDVTITLPENYVVGATGVLQTPSELEFLARKERESREKLARGVDKSKDPFPPSGNTMKTIRYTAEKVHDFAWFADKRFFVLKDTAQLASGRTVDCWAMFTNSESDIWQKGAFYVRRSLEYYSERVGEYPWPHATAVHSALSAGGGMEYPMITVIGNSSSAKSLDEVITHEVGHNWFYGILASNEREHPFMDEGLNSYYEYAYMRRYYGGVDPAGDFGLPRFVFDPKKNGPLFENGYLLLARDHKDTPPDTHSDRFVPIAYGLQVYMKTALCLDWLEAAIGTERFDAAMQAYYRNWQFRHPYPEDLRNAWKSAGLEADWWFDAMQTQRQADFALRSAKKNPQSGEWTLDVRNRGDLEAPFPVTALKNGAPVATRWYDAPGMLTFPNADADAFSIDTGHVALDINRKNNLLRTGGFMPGFEPLDVAVFAPFQEPGRSALAAIPWIGWNNYDKTMIGVLLYNPMIPSRRFQYYIAPGFGTGTGKFAGLADLRWKWFPGGLFPRAELGLSAKTFHFDHNWQDDYDLRFYKVSPQARFELRDRSTSFRQYLNFRVLFIGKENDVREGGEFAGKTYDRYTIYEARYEAQQRKLPNPWKLNTALEWQNGRDAFGEKGRYVRATLEWQQRFFYAPGRKVSLRFFAGGFLQNDRRNRGIIAGDPAQASLALNPQGFNDYRFDQVFLDRSGTEGILARQVSVTEGGFKGAFGAPYAGTTGNSNNFIAAINLKADLPRRLPLGIPLKPWFDIGYFDDATPLGENRPGSEQLLWSGGFALEFFGGALNVYFPLVNSKTLKDRYCEAGGGSNPSALFCGGNYWKWISWSLRFPKLDPAEVLEDLVR
ncbi:MAG: M1 family metallopeptidase [Saprospiraceae bacterium]